MHTKYQILDFLQNEEPRCGLWPHYKLKGRFAAFGPIINLWAASWPLATLHNDEPLCGLWPHYKLKGRFAAFGPIIAWWAASRPLALLYNGGPLCGPLPTFSMHPEFGEFTLVHVFFQIKCLILYLFVVCYYCDEVWNKVLTLKINMTFVCKFNILRAFNKNAKK